MRDLYLLNQWEQWEERYPNFTFIPALSARDPSEPWHGEEGIIADVVDRTLKQAENLDVYLCGPPAMIQTTLEVLRKKGMRNTGVYFDEF